MTNFLQDGDVLVFQGDSITDTGRDTTADGLGSGYVSLIRGWLQARYPGVKYRLFNRGVGGDRTVELLARWKPDCLDLRPTVLSIMVGVNDVWRLRDEWNGQTFVPQALFEENYRRLLDQAGPVDRLVLMSPTTIENERDEELAAHLDQRAAFVRALAREAGAIYVPAREAFQRALNESPEVQWTLDGCHPTPAGHALLASTWLGAVGLQ